MPKMQNVTEAEIEAVIRAMDDSLQDMHDISNRLEKGYCDDLTKPVEHAKNFALIARAASDLVVRIIGKRAMQEQSAELERTLAERARLQKE